MERELPVVAIDDEAGALVLGGSGHLVAADLYSPPGWAFKGVHVATNDPVIAVERTDAPVAIGTDHGLDTAHGWAFRASGEVSPILDVNGTPWIIGPSEWEPWKPNARDLEVAS